MQNPLIAFLRSYHSIPEADQTLIVAAFEPKHYREGESLSHAGKICRELFFICDGVLRIMVQNEKGNEVTHFFLTDHRFCTILNSFNNHTPAAESIQAACNTEVLTISRQKLDQLYEQIPYLKTLIDQIISQGLLDKINIRNSYLGRDSAERYRLFMHSQANVALRVSLNDVASYLGITPQSLSRIRKNIR